MAKKYIPVVTTPSVNNIPHEQLGLVAGYGSHDWYGVALDSAIHTVQNKAADLGADAVVSLQITTIHISSTGAWDIVLLGTAVTLTEPYEFTPILIDAGYGPDAPTTDPTAASTPANTPSEPVIDHTAPVLPPSTKQPNRKHPTRPQRG